jgi:hypothetical protein
LQLVATGDGRDSSGYWKRIGRKRKKAMPQWHGFLLM